METKQQKKNADRVAKVPKQSRGKKKSSLENASSQGSIRTSNPTAQEAQPSAEPAENGPVDAATAQNRWAGLTSAEISALIPIEYARAHPEQGRSGPEDFPEDAIRAWKKSQPREGPPYPPLENLLVLLDALLKAEALEGI